MKSDVVLKALQDIVGEEWATSDEVTLVPYSYDIGGDNAPSRIRIREIHDSGADIVAVTCPICKIMFEDAIKAESLEDKLAVKYQG